MYRQMIAMLSAAAMAAAWTLPAAAQSGGEMTIEQVDPTDPFGEIEVTLYVVDPDTIGAWAGGLEQASQDELRGRCEFMLENDAFYDIAYRAFCRTLLDR